MSALQLHDGLLLFARYAFMPNRLGYCGGDVHGVFETCATGQTSPDVRAWALTIRRRLSLLAADCASKQYC